MGFQSSMAKSNDVENWLFVNIRSFGTKEQFNAIDSSMGKRNDIF